ncbi:MAG: copper homeostasis protein [Bacteroidetes bacterium]|nr:MAG: copper homeostasis protein [Bacteroidota bacterium]
MNTPVIEICAGSIVSAVAAQEGGADRIELCASLDAGGITPSPGQIIITKQKLSIPVFVLIRPREGDFFYSAAEYETMHSDILFCKKQGVDGFVFGLLDAEGNIDAQRNRQLVELAAPLPCTFHRAFDVCRDPFTALEEIISCGFTRILTSGQAATAAAGARLLAELVRKSAGRISIMPGGGISEKNIAALVQQTRATEFHASLKTAVTSKMKFRHEKVSMGGNEKSEYAWMETDPDRVRSLKAEAGKAFQSQQP